MPVCLVDEIRPDTPYSMEKKHNRELRCISTRKSESPSSRRAKAGELRGRISVNTGRSTTGTGRRRSATS